MWLLFSATPHCVIEAAALLIVQGHVAACRKHSPRPADAGYILTSSISLILLNIAVIIV